MKKTYISPATIVVALHTEEAMLATSLTKVSATDSEGNAITADGEEGLSNGRSFESPIWGSEE